MWADSRWEQRTIFSCVGMRSREAVPDKASTAQYCLALLLHFDNILIVIFIIMKYADVELPYKPYNLVHS